MPDRRTNHGRQVFTTGALTGWIQLFVWRQQFAAPAARKAPGFVPVVVAEGTVTPAEMTGRMEIALGPAVVRVGADVDAAALRRVLEVVRGLP